MAAQVIDKATVTQLESLLQDIANEAALIHHMACTAHDENHSEIVGHHLSIIESLAEKIGFFADTGVKKIDPLSVRKGDAEQWFMPPVYHDAVKASNK